MLKLGLIAGGGAVLVLLFGQPAHSEDGFISDGVFVAGPRASVRPPGGLLAGLQAVISVISPPKDASPLQVVSDARTAGTAVLVRCGDGYALCLVSLTNTD